MEVSVFALFILYFMIVHELTINADRYLGLYGFPEFTHFAPKENIELTLIVLLK